MTLAEIKQMYSHGEDRRTKRGPAARQIAADVAKLKNVREMLHKEQIAHSFAGKVAQP